MPLDAHVHFFTRSLLSEKAGRLVALIRAAQTADGFFHRGNSEGALKPSALTEIIDNGLKDRPEDVMASLDGAYGPGWSYVPLMMDIEYALVDYEGGDWENGGGDGSTVSSNSGGLWGRGFSAYSGVAGAFFPDRSRMDDSLPSETSKDAERIERVPRRRLLNRLDEAWGLFFGDGLEKGARQLLAHESFESQRRELTELKAAYSDRVFPFLGLDPRRQHRTGVDLAELVGDYVGPGRPFAGVKLYTSSGYSPTDPVLFGNKGVYAHCRRHRIPITVHFSPSGFATPLQTVRIRGDVYDPLCGAPLPADICRFDTKMTPGTLNDAVRERQMKLNHPRLWEKVLDRWPGLIINFAHAGGAPHAMAWMEDSEHQGWAAWALRQAARRRGVYVDLSGYAGGEADLALLVDRMRKRRPFLKRKILYGSDYFLTSLKDPDVHAYLSNHREAFAPWWKAISERNPKRFLAGGR